MNGGQRASGGGAVVVLAAGRGTRMGVPKALMQVGSRPWWCEQRERLERTGLAQLWVVSRVARERIDLKGGRAGTIEVDDGAPMFASFLRGVRSACEAFDPAVVFVLPVDVPAAGAEVFHTLSRAGREIAVPTFDGVRGHPVCLSRGWLARETGEMSPEDPALRLDELIRGRSAEVAVEDPDVVVNLNTPGAVGAWERARGGGGR